MRLKIKRPRAATNPGHRSEHAATVAACSFAWCSFALCARAVGAVPPPPMPDHIVIVIEENHSFSQVIGSPEAPYMTELASLGANLTNMYAITHPSQPNYLEFFSGTNQGVTSNSLPAGLPFSTPNLAAAIRSAGRTFVSFSEDLPGVDSQVESSGYYFRKHNPVANWTSATAGPNRVPTTVNQPFSAFPTDFDLLPTVALVVPNQLHDMHDGTIAQADQWLEQELGAYAAWCADHNSLLIVTWDEDNSAERNQIPTIVIGAGVRAGTHDTRWTLHNLQRTIVEMCAAQASGAAADMPRMVGLFDADPQVSRARFQQGVAGYAGCVDTLIESANPNADHAAETVLVADGSPLSQVLVRFDGLFGSSAGQVPVNATIVSAKLTLLTGSVSSDSSANRMSTHRLLAPWSDTSTWMSLGGGIALDGVEAISTASFGLLPNTLSNLVIFDATEDVRAWQAGDVNHGWVINPAGTDGWRFGSSEGGVIADRPQLEIAYVEPCAADFDLNQSVSVNDLFAFLAAWFEQNGGAAPAPPAISADFDGSGMVSVNDLFSFLAAWFEQNGGCG